MEVFRLLTIILKNGLEKRYLGREMLYPVIPRLGGGLLIKDVNHKSI